MSTEGETYTDLGDTLPDVVWRGYRSGGMTDEQTAQVMALVDIAHARQEKGQQHDEGLPRTGGRRDADR